MQTKINKKQANIDNLKVILFVIYLYIQKTIPNKVFTSWE